MPSTYAPTYYEHSKGIMPEKHDPFFKFIGIDETLADTGSVEAPVGWVALVYLTEDLIRGMEYEYAPTGYNLTKEEYPEPGWYIIRQDDNGLIWAMIYGEGTLAEEGARADFASAESTYADWCERMEG